MPVASTLLGLAQRRYPRRSRAHRPLSHDRWVHKNQVVMQRRCRRERLRWLAGVNPPSSLSSSSLPKPPGGEQGCTPHHVDNVVTACQNGGHTVGTWTPTCPAEPECPPAHRRPRREESGMPGHQHDLHGNAPIRPPSPCSSLMSLMISTLRTGKRCSNRPSPWPQRSPP